VVDMGDDREVADVVDGRIHGRGLALVSRGGKRGRPGFLPVPASR
jgi:hypothetical protein